MVREDSLLKYYKVPSGEALLPSTYKRWEQMSPEERARAVEERKEKVAALNQKVKENVERIQSSAEFRNFLIAQSRFHDYSFNNQMLIWLQKPDATHVAGFNTWKDLGRQVIKDERGIAILAPLGLASATTWTRVSDGANYAIKRSDKGWAIYDNNEMLIEDGFRSYAAAAGKLKEMGFVERKEMLSVNNFKVVHVFDISQTVGKPLPEFDVPMLTGEANQELLDGLLRLAKDQGVTVSFEPRPHQDPSIKGQFSPPSSIWVRPEEAPAQQLKTLLHELAHYYSVGVFRIPRADAETIAESSAYIVGAHYGFDTGVRSFPYVAFWARDEKTLRANLNSVQEVSERIIDLLEQRKARLMPQTQVVPSKTQREPLYPHVPKSREPVYPRASPHMRAAPVTPEVIDVSGLNKAIEMHRDWLAIPKKEIPGFPLLTREDFTGLIGEKRFILKAIEANKNLDKALQLVNEYLNEHRFLLSRGVEAQGGWSQGKWVEYYGNLKKQLERKVAIPKAEAAPVTPEVTMPKPTRPLIEAEKPAVAEYYRKEAQKWRDIADKEVLTEPSKEGEARFSFAIQKAEAFEKAASELTEFIAAFGRSYAKAFAGIPNAPLTHHIGLRGIAGELGMDFNSPAFKNRVEKMVKEGTLRFAPTREAKDNLLIRMPGLLHEQSIGLVAKRPVAKVTPTWGDVLPSTKKPFIKVGERVRFIGSSRGRYETWPKDAWLEKGVIGTVKEYHPEQPAVRAGGEYFEALPPYAVVRWDFGGNTVIDPDDEGERWERIHHEKSPS